MMMVTSQNTITPKSSMITAAWSSPYFPRLYFDGHVDTIKFVILSTDGTLLVTAGNKDCVVKVWDAKKCRLIHNLDHNELAIIQRSFKISLKKGNAFGNFLKKAAFVKDKAVELTDTVGDIWNEHILRKGRKVSGEVEEDEDDDGSKISALALSSDPNDDSKALILSGMRTGRVVLWNAVTGELLHVLDGGHTACVVSLSFSGAELIATASKDSSIVVWKSSTGEKRLTIRHKDSVNSVSLNYNGILVSGSKDSTVKIWNVNEGKMIREINFNGASVNIARFFPQNNARFITGDSYGCAKIIEVYTGNCLVTFTTDGGPVNSICMSIDGNIVVTGSESGNVKVWSTATQKLLREMKHGSPVKAMSISHDGAVLATVGLDSTAKVWNAMNRELLHSFYDRVDKISAVDISSDGARVVTGSTLGSCKIWSPNRNISILEGHTNLVTCVCLSIDGSIVVTGSDDMTAIVWSSSTGKVIRRLRGHQGSVTSVAISANMANVVTGSLDQTAKLWNLDTGELSLTFEGHDGPIYTVQSASLSKGDLIVTAGEDNTARIWDVKTRELMQVLTHDGAVRCTVASQDARYIVTGSEDRTAIIWNLSGSKLSVLKGHKGAVNAVCISSDCKIVASGSEDFSVIIWLVLNGNKLHVLEELGSSINALMFSWNTSVLISGADDGTVTAWKMTRSRDSVSEVISRPLSPTALFGNNQTPVLGIDVGIYNTYIAAGGNVLVLDNDMYNIDSLVDEGLPIWDEPFASSRILAAIGDLKLIPSETAINEGVDNYIEIVSEGSSRCKGSVFYEGCLSWTHKKSRSPVTAFTVPVKNIVGLHSKFLEYCIFHSESVKKLQIFENEVVDAVIAFKWGFVQYFFVQDFALYIVKTFLYLTNSIVFHYYAFNDQKSVKHLGITLWAVVVSLKFYFLWFQYLTCYSLGFRRYVMDLWTFLNGTSVWLSLLSLALQLRLLISGEETHESKTEDAYRVKVLNAFVFPIFFFEILQYLEGFDTTGPLVRMILKIVSGIKWFMLIIMIAVLLFACSFVVLFQDASADSGFGAIDSSILHVYGFLYGAYSADTMLEATSPNAAVLLGSIFMFFVVIVMLNMLISLMGDKHDEAQENAKAEFNFGRARLIQKYEKLISKWIKLSNIKSWYPNYLQVLKCTRESNDVSVDWTGKVKAIQATVNNLERKMTAKFNDVHLKFESIDTKLDSILKQMNCGNASVSQETSTTQTFDLFSFFQTPNMMVSKELKDKKSI